MSLEDLKREAARQALDYVEPRMRLGLGTGSTAWHFVDLLGEKVANGLKVICVPTSERTAAQAEQLNIPLADLSDLLRLDLTVDGADEFDPALNLTKGGGGALLREKIVAHASERMFVIADETKEVDALGAYPLPIEVNPYAVGATLEEIRARLSDLGEENVAVDAGLRLNDQGGNYETDGGHYIVDASFGRNSKPQAISNALLEIPGVVQHGLFINMCEMAFVASASGVKTLKPKTEIGSGSD